MFVDREKYDPSLLPKGMHGYNSSLDAMHAVLMARGSAFKPSSVLSGFHNVNVYGIIACVLGIIPLPNNGTLEWLNGFRRDYMTF